MATLTITNLTSSPVYITELYTSVLTTAPLVTSRPLAALSGMAGLQAAITAATVSLAVTPTADELASGLLSPPNAVGADDLLAVTAATVTAPLQTMRIPLTSGGATGTADVVTVFAVNTLPYKFRVLDVAIAFISVAGAGGTSMTIDTVSAGGGTLVGTLATASTGRVVSSAPLASVVVTPSSTAGLFVRRTDRSTVGEIILTIRRES